MEINKIYYEDCLIGMTKIPDKSINLILCDLPYGTTQCNWDTIIPFDDLWEQYKRIIKDDGCILLFGCEPFSSYLRLSNIDWFKYDIVWDKIKGTGFLNAKKQPMRNHEIISVFYKNQCTYNPQKTKGHPRKISYKGKHHQTEVYGEMKNDYLYDSTERFPRSIVHFSTDTQNTNLHPTQKPVALCCYLIETYSNVSDLVLDNCMGSGTTAIACIETNRNYIGFENNQTYYQLSQERINQLLTIKSGQLFK